MSNPDITPYVDLTIFDKDPQDIFELAKSLFTLRTGNSWTPREGNMEVLLLESEATMVAELVYAINRVPGALTKALLAQYGIDRDEGEVPTTSIRFNMAGTSGYTIPAGVAVRLELDGGLEPVTFVTDVELTIVPGQSFGTVAATGDVTTADTNGTPPGTPVEVLDSLVYVENAEIATTVLRGRDPETDLIYFDRAVQRFSRLSDALVLPRHFTSYAMEQAYVNRAFTIDNYNPLNDADGNGPVGSDAGHVTVAVYGDGAVLTSLQKTELLNEMDQLAEANLAIHIIDPTITIVNVTTQVVKDLGWETDTVIANVQNTLNDYLSVDNWNWSSVVRRNELIQVIGSTPGVAYVNTITTPGADLVLPKVANLTTPGVISVTVA